MSHLRQADQDPRPRRHPALRLSRQGRSAANQLDAPMRDGCPAPRTGHRRTAAMIRIALMLLAIPAFVSAADDKRSLKPINLEKLNTAADEDDPHAGSSGLTLFYSSNAKKKFDILISRRANQGVPWLAGKPLGDYIQSETDDRS